MQRTITITDLTQMERADQVCIAGIDSQNRCIRPVLPGGVRRRHLYIGGRLAIRPRAKVRFDFRPVQLEPPHIEDMEFTTESIADFGLRTDTEWEAVLKATSFVSVGEIYDGLLQKNRWVAPGTNTRSLGTLSQVTVNSIYFSPFSNRPKPRLSFKDRAGFLYDLPISDLALRTYVDSELTSLGSTSAVSQKVLNLLINVDCLYLRIGLARPWVQPNTGKTGCWMQVTAIHTFPDYLRGKSFADL